MTLQNGRLEPANLGGGKRNNNDHVKPAPIKDPKKASRYFWRAPEMRLGITFLAASTGGEASVKPAGLSLVAGDGVWSRP